MKTEDKLLNKTATDNAGETWIIAKTREDAIEAYVKTFGEHCDEDDDPRAFAEKSIYQACWLDEEIATASKAFFYMVGRYYGYEDTYNFISAHPEWLWRA